MVDFSELSKLHATIDRQLQARESEAIRKGHSRKAYQAGRQRQLNDHVYFLMLFAQFEKFISDKSQDVIRLRKKMATWKSRRAWDIIDHQNIERLPFMNRIALLTEKGKTDYNIIYQLYKDRNSLAHGQLPDTSISFPTAVRQLQVFKSRL